MILINSDGEFCLLPDTPENRAEIEQVIKEKKEVAEKYFDTSVPPVEWQKANSREGEGWAEQAGRWWKENYPVTEKFYERIRPLEQFGREHSMRDVTGVTLLVML